MTLTTFWKLTALESFETIDYTDPSIQSTPVKVEFTKDYIEFSVNKNTARKLDYIEWSVSAEMLIHCYTSSYDFPRMRLKSRERLKLWSVVYKGVPDEVKRDA